MKKISGLSGTVPRFYHPDSIWVICTKINELIHVVNKLIEMVDELKRERDDGK